MSISVSIRPDGTVEAIFDPAAVELYESLGSVTRRRASHVVPCGPWRRWVFRWVRSRVADDSRLAGVCRRIPGRWLVFTQTGEVLGPFRRRSDAIAAEISVLHGRGL